MIKVENVKWFTSEISCPTHSCMASSVSRTLECDQEVLESILTENNSLAEFILLFPVSRFAGNVAKICVI